jgi:hypothetical protein
MLWAALGVGSNLRAILQTSWTMATQKAYGTARGLNYRRTVSLISVVTDDGVVGYGFHKKRGPYKKAAIEISN